MAGLVDDIRGAISSDTISALAGQLGESPQNTGNALSGAIPVILAAIAGKVTGGAGGTSSVVSLIQSALSRGNPFDQQADLANPPGPGAAPDDGGLASGLLGGQFGTIASTLAEKFGLKTGSLRTLLGVAGLLGAGGIGRALGGNVTPQGLTDLIGRERGSILSALPAGLGGLLGSFGSTASGAADRVGAAATDTVEAAGAGIGKWLPWLLLVAAAIAAFLLLKSCGTDTPAPAPVPTDTTAVVAPAPTVPVAIPTGSGVVSETREGKPALVVYFDVGKSAVSKDLSTAAASVKDYLTANPTATLAVSGFNDPTGNAAANAKLSKSRAEEVSKALAATGIAADKIALVKPAEASGTGDTNAQSRRVEVTIAQ